MSVAKRKGSRFYWYRFELAGTEYRGSTHQEDPELARRVEIDKKAEISKAAPIGAGPERGQGRLIVLGAEEIADAEDRGVSTGHLRTLRWVWRSIRESFGENATARDVTFESVKEHITKRRKAGFPGQSIIREVAALKRATATAAERGWILRPPAKWPKVKSDAADPKRSGKLWPVESIVAVLEQLPIDAADEYLFAALTGIRAAELKRIEPGWLETTAAGPMLRLPAWATKTRTERTVMLSAPAAEIIERRKDRERVFSGSEFQWRVKTASRKAGLSSALTLRDLRVFFATSSLEGSNDATAVQATLGHGDLRTTQRYLRSTLERGVAASNAAAAKLGVGTEPRTANGKAAKRKAKPSQDVAWEATLLEQFQALECASCVAELRSVIEAHAAGRHSSVVTVRPIQRAA